MNKQELTVGFIGTGVMGQGMAMNLIKAGYPLIVYTRTKQKAASLLEAGAAWCENARSLASKADVIITIVGFPQDVQEVYLESGGILENARPDTVVIDMTTSKPTLAKEIYDAAHARGIHALDAPVSGGDIGARDGKLSIMVGGDPSAYEKVKAIFEVMGANIVYQGEAGSGQHTKMCNQIAIASGMMGVCEALRYADHSGLDAKTVLQSIAAGAAGSWNLSNLAPRIIEGDFDPGFYIKHFIKDMRIALESAQEMNLRTPGLEQALSMYEALADQGEGELGTQALYHWYE